MARKKNRKVLLMMVVCMLLTTSVVFAQSPPDNPDTVNVGAPFDGGLSMVIAAGAGYAMKKARDKRKQFPIKDQIEK